jgi:hypothetical protein
VCIRSRRNSSPSLTHLPGAKATLIKRPSNVIEEEWPPAAKDRIRVHSPRI